MHEIWGFSPGENFGLLEWPPFEVRRPFQWVLGMYLSTLKRFQQKNLNLKKWSQLSETSPQTKSMKPFKSFICSFIRTNMSKQFCYKCWRRGRKKLLWFYCWNIFINFEWSSSGFKNPNSQIYFWLKIKTNFYL